MSPLKKLYSLRLVFRIAVFILCLYPALTRPEFSDIMTGWNFFRSFSMLHLLWALWVWDMLCQLFPLTKHIALGSRKHFPGTFVPAEKLPETEAGQANAGTYRAVLKKAAGRASRAALRVALIWCAGLIVLFFLYRFGLISRAHIFLICLLFYVCDLICVVIWCPFRVIMGNRCCTDCRIFNWDHLMMFSVFFPVPSFFTTSLLLLSIAVCALWEIRFFRHPERFFEKTNRSLRCENCSDRLCGGKRKVKVLH
ncbi:MAG: hypothetical protein K5985_10580 [Lachnospiraceae bacterium]|nr:hypothetical protein [Lachnospiraceae bacterium]